MAAYERWVDPNAPDEERSENWAHTPAWSRPAPRKLVSRRYRDLPAEKAHQHLDDAFDDALARDPNGKHKER